MNKEIDNFVDEFITELENSRIEREENIKNFIDVFNQKVPTDYKFELESFDNYIWKSKMSNKTLEVGISDMVMWSYLFPTILLILLILSLKNSLIKICFKLFSRYCLI